MKWAGSGLTVGESGLAWYAVGANGSVSALSVSGASGTSAVCQRCVSASVPR